MSLTELKLEYKISKQQNKGIPVIIAAAGASRRMGGENKQFSAIAGIPVLAKTLLAFENSDEISSIIVVTSKESINEVQLLAEEYMIEKLTDIVEGGRNRAESVKNGFACLDAKCQKVLIHDGARPLVDNETICRVVKTLETEKAVCPAVPVKDTLKTVNNGEVTATLDREKIVSIQTPQGVWANEYRQALEKANDFSSFTDDMSVMESAGFKVVTVMGSYKNIKITTPEDLIVANAFVESEEEV